MNDLRHKKDYQLYDNYKLTTRRAHTADTMI